MVGRSNGLSGLATALPPAAAQRVHAQVQVVRTSAVGATLAPGLAMVYVLGTWDRPHRPAMLVVTLALLAVAATAYRRAPQLAGFPGRRIVQAGWAATAIVACAALSLLDGGVARPLGLLVPISLIYLATVTPPTTFVAFACLSGVAYGVVVVLGQPPPAGYSFVYALGTASIAYSCLRQAAVLVSLRRRLADVVRRDPLTGRLNRRGFDEQLAHELAEATRTGEPVTLVLADLDRFKEVNDVHGHQAGDDLLAWTGRTLGEALQADTVGRLGGDEFGVVLTGLSGEDARAVVERLGARLDASVPASLGYATFPTEATTVDDLKHLADQRVYACKMGRNRRPPSAEAVADARVPPTQLGLGGATRRDRRRRSIANVGWHMTSNCAIGLLYGVFFAVGAPRRLPLVLLCLIGAVSGLAMVWAADRLGNSASVHRLMMVSAVWLYGLAVGGGVIDGGVASALGLGMLAPIPLVALGAPLRLAAVMVGVASALYVTVGLLLGGASGWYIATHLVGMLFVAAGCALSGRTAARQRKLLNRLAVTDVLTGCLNRRGFDDRCTTALVPADGHRRAVALLVFDLDGFKRLNDTDGHAAGDELLRWVATTLASNLRPGDVVGRLGGDEFVVMLAAEPATGAPAFAERLRAVLAERTATSVGVAVSDVDGGTFDALYTRADARLYADKSRRRAAAFSTASNAAGTEPATVISPSADDRTNDVSASVPSQLSNPA